MLNISAVGVFLSATILGVCFHIHDQTVLPSSAPNLPLTTTVATTTLSLPSVTDSNVGFIDSMNESYSPLEPALAHFLQASHLKATAPPAALSPALSYVALISAVTYMASYSLGYGPLPWVIMSELIPLRARATVGGVAVFLTWGLTFLVTKVFAPLSDCIGVAGCFWIFAGFSIISLVRPL